MHDLMTETEPWSFGVIAIREGHEVGADSVKSLYDVGCVGTIRQVEQHPDGRYAVLLVGEQRFRVTAYDESRPYLQAAVDLIDESSFGDLDEAAAPVRERFVDYCAGLGSPAAAATLPDDPAALSYVVAATMLLPLADRQALLETAATGERLQAEAGLLSRELALLRIGTMPVTQPQLPPYSQN